VDRTHSGKSPRVSIGFQVYRALRIEHMMKRSLYGALGLGVEEVRGPSQDKDGSC
jgi:hypothetical protein